MRHIRLVKTPMGRKMPKNDGHELNVFFTIKNKSFRARANPGFDGDDDYRDVSTFDICGKGLENSNFSKKGLDNIILPIQHSGYLTTPLFG